MKFLFKHSLILVVLLANLTMSCNPGEPGQAETITTEKKTISDPCIKRIIAKDDSLGTIRNHACEKISLEKTILDYAEAMARLDYGSCPPEFTSAFNKHRVAWLEMAREVKKYPELRGEMHDLFDQIEAGQGADLFKPLLKAIWDTWAEVEKEFQ